MALRARCVLAVAAILVGGCGPQPPEHEIVESGTHVRIALSEVADGEVHFFTFLHRGTRVNFLVRSDGPGRLQVHLDACYGCYRYKLGFVVEGTDLVCRACRLRYPIEDEVWDFIGACAPIPMHSALDGDDLSIDRKRLERAAQYF